MQRKSLSLICLLFSFLSVPIQLMLPCIDAEGGESATVQLLPTDLSNAPPVNNQGSPTRPPQTPPIILTHPMTPTLTVAGVPLELPNRACGDLIERALQKDQEIYVADDTCRMLMEQALQIQRNAPPVQSQRAILRIIPLRVTPIAPPAAARSSSNTPPLVKSIPNSQ